MKSLKSVIRKSMAAITLALLVGSMASPTSALTLSHTVDATDNLYYSDWGHWFTQAGDGALAATGSTSASAVVNGGSAYNFSPWDYLDITVTGSVTDAASEGQAGSVTGADGCISQSDPCWFGNGQFRFQDVYSVIGLWSSSADSITPILVDNIYKDWRDAVFLVGSNVRLEVPKIENAYLFLAENDGYFNDNLGSYTATIIASVPEPASALLMLTSLLGLFAIRRRR
ncbi:MAG: PEP-CTERM sorting domain-containing protein [Oceanicoccus sp.]